MSLVRIHCWSCARSVEVDEQATAGGLAGAGWAVAHGETYCPECASERELARGEPVATAPSEPDGVATVSPAPPRAGGPPEIEQVPPYAGGESRFARSVRMLSASFRVLRENPGLAIFPVISVVLSIAVGAFCFSVWAPQVGAGTGAHARDSLLVPGLLAAYPLTFISIYCSVALVEVLSGRLDGRQTTIGQGFSAANSRLGVIAAWSLLACTVGLALRLLEERLPLAGRIAVGLFGLAWSLATVFAVPILAYEGLGPVKTVERSAQIFKRRWGAQIGGSIGIGAAAMLLSIPLAVLLFVGLTTAGSGGAAIVVLAGAGLFALGAGVAAMEQIYRVFVYRSAVGMDTSAGPFSQDDLRSPFSKRR